MLKKDLEKLFENAHHETHGSIMYGYISEDLKNSLEALSINYEEEEAYGGEDCGSEYYFIYSFTRGDEKVYCKWEGYYQSYVGSEFESWYFVEPFPTQVIEFKPCGPFNPVVTS